MDSPDSKHHVLSKRLTKLQNNLPSFTHDKRARDLARFIEKNNLKTLSEVGSTAYKELVRCQNWYRYQLKIKLSLFEVELIYFSLQNIP